MWTRQFTEMWTEYLDEKRREATIEHDERRCIKQPLSFSMVSRQALEPKMPQLIQWF